MKRPFRMHIEFRGQLYTAIYDNGFCPIWRIYKGNRKAQCNYITSYEGFGETMMPSAMKAKFLSDMEKGVIR